MSWTWVSSAAVVGLLVSTLIFSWQRSLEYKFQLQKEKRELFGKIISQCDRLFRGLVSGEMDDISHLWKSESWTEAHSLLALLKLYDAPGVYLAFRTLMTAYHEKGQAGPTPGLSPQEQIGNLLELQNMLEEEMRLALAETVRPFSFMNKKRFRFKPQVDLHSQFSSAQHTPKSAQEDNP